jgi:hypothetical protein
MILKGAKRVVLLVFALNIEYSEAKSLDIPDPVSRVFSIIPAISIGLN